MPNIKSAIKRVKVEEARAKQNRIVKSRLKTTLKKFETAVASGDAELDAVYRQAVSMVDKAASKGVIHKNASNRKKAQLASALQKTKA